MNLVDMELISHMGEFRRCGYCNRPLRYRPHVHHIFSRGAGRVDVPGNLIPLGGPADCNCHGLTHSGHLLRADLLAVAAARERTTQGEIERQVYEIRRSPKSYRADRPQRLRPRRER